MITAPLVALITQNDAIYSSSVADETRSAKLKARKDKRKRQSERKDVLYSRSTPLTQRCIDLASEKGASSWLTTLPLLDQGLHLHKGNFRDALCLRYNWSLPNVPSTCASGAHFSITHELSCPKGGFVIQRHNDLRDITAKALSEICRDVQVEPPLQPLNGETFSLRSAITSDEARVDVCARSFWCEGQDAFFDIRAFNPFASSFQSTSLRSLYQQQQKGKRRTYQQRVLQVEYLWFSRSPVEWLLKRPFFLSSLLPNLRLRETRGTAVSCLGCAVGSAFLCYGLPSRAFMAAAPCLPLLMLSPPSRGRRMPCMLNRSPVYF